MFPFVGGPVIQARGATPRVIQLTREPIVADRLLAQVASPRAGAVVLFLGTTRELTGQLRTAWLEYESYAEMADTELQRLRTEACRRWGLCGCAILHRLGRLEPGEASVAIAVSAPHRGDAFAAGQWLIDSIKQVVPIWKQELWADGTSQWVHPGLELPVSLERRETSR
jgi:molybdopterin synthase catalytic subunit